MSQKKQSSLRLGVLARVPPWRDWLRVFRLELDGGPAPAAFDSHQVSQDLGPGPPAGAIRLAYDPLRERLHPHPSLHPPTALAQMDVSQLGEGRPGQAGQHLSVVRTTAFVHGWSMLLVCFLVHIVMMAITRTLLDRMSTSAVHAEDMTGFVCRPFSDKRTIQNFFASLASLR